MAEPNLIIHFLVTLFLILAVVSASVMLHVRKPENVVKSNSFLDVSDAIFSKK